MLNYEIATDGLTRYTLLVAEKYKPPIVKQSKSFLHSRPWLPPSSRPGHSETPLSPSLPAYFHPYPFLLLLLSPLPPAKQPTPSPNPPRPKPHLPPRKSHSLSRFTEGRGWILITGCATPTIPISSITCPKKTLTLRISWPTPRNCGRLWFLR